MTVRESEPTRYREFHNSLVQACTFVKLAKRKVIGINGKAGRSAQADLLMLRV